MAEIYRGTRWAGLLLFFIVALWFLRTPFICHRYFALDEFQHLHVSRALARGQLPYRDFFEHHPVVFHSLFIPLYHLLGDSLVFLFAGRILALLLVTLLLLLMYRLGRTFTNRRGALTGVLLFSMHPMIWDKTLEVRPAILFTVCWVLGMRCAIRFVRGDGRVWALLTGLAAGCSIAVSQKGLVTAGLLTLIILLDTLRMGDHQRRVVSITGALLAGMAAPLLLLAAILQAKGIFTLYLQNVFLLSLHWKFHFSPVGNLRYLLIWSPVHILFGSTALLMACRPGSSVHARIRQYLALLSIGGVAFLFAIPNPFRQNFLIFLVPFLVLAGEFIGRIYTEWSDWKIATIPIRHVTSIAIAVAILLFGIHARNELRITNHNQLSDIAWILKHVPPDGSVMDGWTGLGVLRDHCQYYWFLHRGILTLLTENQKRVDLLNCLKQKKPEIVIYDVRIRDISPEVHNYICLEYKFTGRHCFRKRRSEGEPVPVETDRQRVHKTSTPITKILKNMVR